MTDPTDLEQLGVEQLSKLKWSLESLLQAVKTDLDRLRVRQGEIAEDHEDSGRRIVNALAYLGLRAVLDPGGLQTNVETICSGIGKVFQSTPDFPRLRELSPQQRLAARLDALAEDLEAFQSAWARSPFHLGLRKLGLVGVIPRGERRADWPVRLANVQSRMIFFGRDHSKLLEHQRETLERWLKDAHTHVVEFYLLSFDDPYYKNEASAEEKEDRKRAEEGFRRLRAAFPAQVKLMAHHRPSDIITVLDDNYGHFGHYISGVPNKDTFEYITEKPTESSPWIWTKFETELKDDTKEAEPIK